MKNKKEKAPGRRLLSVLLTLCVTCTMLPSVAFAQAEMVVEPHLQSRAVVKSISTDDYTFESVTGTLTIYTDAGTTKWRESVQPSDVKNVVIKHGVTTIGERAFGGCVQLAYVDISEGVTAIGAYSFSNCTLLRGIDTPGSVTSIGDHTFEGCTCLNRVKMSEGVESIGNCAFIDCDSLAYIDIPSSILHIGNSAFANRKIKHRFLSIVQFESKKAPEVGTGVFQWVFDGYTMDNVIVMVPSGAGVTGYTGDGATSNWGKYKYKIGGDNDYKRYTRYKDMLVQKTYGDTPFINPVIRDLGDDEADAWSAERETSKLEIDHESGEVTIKGAGTECLGIFITRGNTGFKARYILNVDRAPLTVEFDNQSMEVGGAIPDFTYKVTGLVNGDKVKHIKIDPTEINVDKEGTYDIDGTKVEIESVGGECENACYNYDLTYIKGSLTVKAPEPKVSYVNKAITKSYGDTVFTNPITSSDDAGTITYSSSDPKVATVNASTGEVKIVGTGRATITATATNNTTASYTLTVSEATPPAPAPTTPGGRGSTNSTSNVIVNLPKYIQEKVLHEKIKNTTLKVDTPEVSINLDLLAVAAINRQANADVQVSAQRTDVAKLSKEAQAAIGGRPTYELSATYAGGSKHITDFGEGEIAIAIPYILQKGEQAANVCAIYVNDNGNVNYLSNSSYDSKAKAVRFTTSHFSVYGVGYKENTVSVNFADIANHWAKQDIESVANKGLMSGTGNNLFTPDGAMTRGMFVTTLGRLAGVNAADYTSNKFSDVQADAYYAPYVNWAAEKGIVSGTAENTFSPDKSVTRQEMAVMMSNYVKAMGSKLPQTHQAITFVDSSAIASWSKEAVNQMQTAGIISGRDDNSFDPAGTATRGEVATTLCRFVDVLN